MTLEYVKDYIKRYIGCRQASDDFCSLSGGCKNCEYNRDSMTSEKMLKIMVLIDDALQKADADGCDGCVYQNFLNGGIPCVMCKRNSRDYWEKK